MPEQVLSVRSRAGAGKSAIVKLGGRVALQKPGRGWNVLVIDGATNLKRSNQSFDTYGAPAAAEAAMLAFLGSSSSIAHGDIVIVAVMDTVKAPVSPTLVRALEQLGAVSRCYRKIRTVYIGIIFLYINALEYVTCDVSYT